MSENIVIQKIKAREIFDSRGNPTIEVDLFLSDGNMTRAMVPSGASTGVHEALELRDGGKRLLGKGVLKAVQNVNEVIQPKVQGLSPVEQKNIDEILLDLDGTENKSKLGANAVLAVSMATCKAGALVKQVPLYEHVRELSGRTDLILPVPSFNVINGGAHAGNDLAIQEFMLFPMGARSFRNAMEIGVECYQTLKIILKQKYGRNAINVGDEGGFAPPLATTREALDLLLKTVEECGYEDEIKFTMDAAASEFFKDGKYHVDGNTLTSEQLLDYYEDLITTYPLVSLEDPFQEEDFVTPASLTQKHGERLQVVGDDLLVTNIKRIRMALEKRSVNALLLKVNQIGTVSESIEAATLAFDNHWGVMVSHRSGETTDPFIAHLVVGLATGQIKSGAPCRSERLAKYNELLRIEEQMRDEGKSVRYAGTSFRAPL